MSGTKQAVITDFSDAAVIENFRITADGALKKREGIRILCNFGERVRGALSDITESYVVAGSSLWRLTGDTAECLGMMWDAEFYENERCALLLWQDCIYIIGGGVFYRYTKSTGVLASVEGYAPALLRNVTDSVVGSGSPCEDPNILSSRAATLLKPSTSYRDYVLWGTPTAIDSVTADGVPVPPSAYRILVYTDTSHVEFTDRSYLTASVIRVEYSCPESEAYDRRSELLHNVSAAVYEDGDNARLFIWGGTLGPDVMYSEMSHADGVTEAPTLDYFPARCRFTVGDGSQRVTSVNKLDGKTVIVTEGSLHEPTSSSAVTEHGLKTRVFGTKVMLYNHGSSASAGTVSADGKLYIMSSRGLFKVEYDKLYGEYVTKCLVSASGGTLSDEMRLYLNINTSELWYHSGRRAYIVNTETGERYCFNLPEVEAMFTHKGTAAFISGTCAYIFDSSEGLDAGAGFESVYESHPIAPEGYFTEKTLRSFGVALDIGSRIAVTLTSDKGISFTHTLSSEGETGVSPAVLGCHAHLGGVSHVTVRLVCPADTVSGHIRAVMLGYGKKGDAK